MLNLAQSYGVRRPLEIAAKVAALRAQFAPKPIAPPVAPVAVQSARITRGQIAAWQAERAQLRADLPTLRHYAIDAEFGTPGPSFEEVRAAESRLETLDDYLMFEPDFAAAVAEMRLAA